MKDYTPEEIIKYAKRQIAFSEQQKYVFPFVVTITLVALILFVLILRDVLLSVISNTDKSFTKGFVIGAVFVCIILILASSFARLLRRIKGPEYQAYKRLIELESTNNER